MKLTPICLALTAAIATGTAHAAPAKNSQQALLDRLEQMASEMEALKSELKTVKEQASSAKVTAAKADQTASKAAADIAAAPTATYAATPAKNLAGASMVSPAFYGPALASGQTSLFGYGEINYNNYRRDSSKNQADVRRAIIGITHQASDKTRIVSELEVEHAVTSADDSGEVAVEQLYIEHLLNDKVGLKGGLFLIPMGFMNLNHEPTAYYGVERNFVETGIIPSTWREVGLSAFGVTDAGLRWDTGVTTGFNLGKWNSAEGLQSPLAAIHQEGQKARAHDLSWYGSLSWRGTPGLEVGGSVFTGKAGQKNNDPAPSRFALLNNARITLSEVHARWQPGKWDLAALYSRGRISGTGDYNLATALDGTDNPIPKSFYGWYTQPANKLWDNGEYSLSPFGRYEKFNTAAKYENMPAGMEIADGLEERVITVGANLRVGPSVVLKADVQRFRQNKDMDRFNLGLGYQF
jgi:hypothetical protein